MAEVEVDKEISITFKCPDAVSNALQGVIDTQIDDDEDVDNQELNC